jgi:hypothetical protein
MPPIGRDILLSGAVSFGIGFVLSCVLFGHLVRGMAANCRKLERILQARSATS